MADVRNILAGIGAGGAAGLSLAYFAPAGTTGPAATAGTDGVQTVSISGAPTGGTFTLTWDGKTTAPIAYSASAADVATALNALSGSHNGITATGGALPATNVAVTFPAYLPQVLMTATGSFTGGTTPAVSVANTTPGTQSVNEATATIPAAFLDSGWCDQKGLGIKTNVSSNDVKGYGSTQTLRTIMTDAKKTIDLTFLETNKISVAVYLSQPLDSITVDPTGAFKVSTGKPEATQYSAVFDALDGSNHMRYYAPFAQNISPGDLSIGAGNPIVRPISLVLYPDSNGNTLYEYYVVNALGA